MCPSQLKHLVLLLRDAIAASVSIDSMLPHTEQVHAKSAIHVDTDDTDQEGLFVETEELRAEVKKIVDEYASKITTRAARSGPCNTT